MDGLGENLEDREVMCADPSDPYFEMFKAAYTGKLDLFQNLALDHANGKGIGVTEEIRKAKDKDGRGSLHIAAEGGSLQVCKYLIETLKLDVDPKDDKGITPLYQAIIEGHLDTVRYLLDKGADADVSNDENNTPLRFAAETGDAKIITLLLSRGARVDVASNSGTALGAAASNGHRDAVKVLLDHGANPNGASAQIMHNGPLLSALSRGSWECVELLLQAGADPNAVFYGYTPLASAIGDGRVDVIRRLLEAGADPNYKMSSGLTALEFAALYGDSQSVGVLFPVTSRIPTYPDWSIAGLMRHVNSDANKMQREVYVKEKFRQVKSKGIDAFQEKQYLIAADWFLEAMGISPQDAAILSNLSACYARLGDGSRALEYAIKCTCRRLKWPKAYYRLGVALNVQKRYDDAADAFNKGLALDPENKELKDAYMKAIEASYQSGRG